MSAPGDDPLHAIWSSAAPSWALHADFVDERGTVVEEAMLAVAGIRPGDRVLELGCGPGGVGFAAADLVGPGGQVVLSDVVSEMTAIAAARAERRALPNVVVRELDMEHLNVADGSFDAVLCREALMLVANPTEAARQALRVLRPGGRAVFAVWGPPTANPWLSALLGAVGEQLGARIPPPGTPGPFALSDDGALGGVLTAVGFEDVEVRAVSVPMQVGSFDQWWTIVPSLAGPVAGLLASLPDDMTAAIRACAESALAPFSTESGYLIPGLSLVGVGHQSAKSSP